MTWSFSASSGALRAVGIGRICWVLGALALGLAVAGGTAYAAPPQRGYELVSRGDGNFGDVLRVLGASDSGDRVAYDATGGTAGSNSSLLLSSTVSGRTSSGWTSASSDARTLQFVGGVVRLYQPVAVSSDFSKLLISSTADLVPDDADGGSGADLYLVDVGTGAVTWLTGGLARPDTVTGATPRFVGASRDLTRIYFTMEVEPLLSGAAGGALYEWHNGQLELVNGGPVVWAHSLSGFDVSLASSAARRAHGGPHAVSDDGTTIFVADGSGLYARAGGTLVQANASQRAGGGPPAASPVFVGASSDGNLVYFTSSDQLTDAATPGGGLYRYTLSSGTLTQVTPDAGDPGGAGVTDVLMSDDASHVYFVATAALTSDAQAGVANVYVASGTETRLIASVPEGATVQRVSRSGRFAVIRTTGALAGATTDGHVALYEYDAQARDVVCVSCRSDGAPSQGDASVDDTAPAGISSFPELSAPRNITDDGHVFFASSDELVANDATPSWDVYEFADGALSLLTSGSSQYDSFVADNSDDGTDAFVVTHSSLLPEDADSGLADIYDARLGGGFPQPVPDNTVPCTVDCQRPIPPPALLAPGSATLQDPGNLVDEPSDSAASRATIVVSPVKAVSGTAVTLRVKVSAPGAISVSGSSVRMVKRSAARAATYSLRMSLTAKAKRTLKRRRTLKATVSVTFTPKSGAAASKRLKVTFRQPRAKRSTHAASAPKGGQ